MRQINITIPNQNYVIWQKPLIQSSNNIIYNVSIYKHVISNIKNISIKLIG